MEVPLTTHSQLTNWCDPEGELVFLPGGGLSMLHLSLRRVQADPTRPTNLDRLLSRTEPRRVLSCNTRLREHTCLGPRRGFSPEALSSTRIVRSNSPPVRSDSLPDTTRARRGPGYLWLFTAPRVLVTEHFGVVFLILTLEPDAIT